MRASRMCVDVVSLLLLFGMRAQACVDLFSLHFFAVQIKQNRRTHTSRWLDPCACVFVRALTQLDVFISAARSKTQQAGVGSLAQNGHKQSNTIPQIHGCVKLRVVRGNGRKRLSRQLSLSWPPTYGAVCSFVPGQIKN